MTRIYDKLKRFGKRRMLFHGSPQKFEILQGSACRPVYATNIPSMAIVYASAPRHKRAMSATYDLATGEIHAPEEFIKGMTPGYVHVVPRTSFRSAPKNKPGEYVTYEPVTPVRCIEVGPEDLPCPAVPLSTPESKFLRTMFAQQIGPIRKGFRNSCKRHNMPK